MITLLRNLNQKLISPTWDQHKNNSIKKKFHSKRSNKYVIAKKMIFDSINLGLLFLNIYLLYIHWPFLYYSFFFWISRFGFGTNCQWYGKNGWSIAKERFWCNPKTVIKQLLLLLCFSLYLTVWLTHRTTWSSDLTRLLFIE